MGYFHVKSVPELADAETTWDIFISSQHVNIRDYFFQLLELPYPMDIYFEYRTSVS